MTGKSTRGNLPRHRDCIASKDGDCHTSLRTGSQRLGIRGVGISFVIETALLLKMEIATPV